MASIKINTFNIKLIAQAGLISKGIVYCLLGILTFMAAFHISGRSTNTTDKAGVFDIIYKQTGGQIMLGIIAGGLICYCIWRCVQTFADTENKGNDTRGIISRSRYLFSCIVYGSIALQMIRILLLSDRSGSGDKKQDLARELLSKPYGEWLVGIAAVILLGTGIYQIYYGLSEQYLKHVERTVNRSYKKELLAAGKIGYVTRGIVWLLIAFLFFKAAIHSNSSEAGDTSKAFAFLQDASYGSYLLGAVGIGLICYGAFSFIRARYENFN